MLFRTKQKKIKSEKNMERVYDTLHKNVDSVASSLIFLVVFPRTKG